MGLRPSEQAAWYEIRGDHQGEVARYVLSTAGTRAICNKPELLGVRFNQRLHEAMTQGLRSAPFRPLIEQHPEERICVVNFLRGGLNFELRRALNSAYGFNRHSSAFMSSQRYREDGRWGVKEDMYRKLEIPSDALLIMGDVVATGVTMENGLNVILDHLLQLGSSVRALVFFTIGCHKAEKVLDDVHERMSASFPGYEGTYLVYLEAKFHLVDSRTPLRIGIPGTDLVRHGALLAPPFALSQYEAPAHALERCAIYDAGSRAFDIPSYLSDVREYWEEVRQLADEGWSLGQALRERWPGIEERDEPAFIKGARERWPDISDRELDQLREKQLAFWSVLDAADNPSGLRSLCDLRLEALRLNKAPARS